ncbi:MAG TPA: HAD-IB family phosphatase [Nitrososphaera sp.]|nr:HAD-IB family phosphatase [Nitrososphaera sp.]
MDVGLAAFDMDGTLTQGRLVFALADKFGLSQKVRDIQGGGQEGHVQTREIAALFSGLSKNDLVTAVESIPLTKNCEKAVSIFKEKNYKLGIISDSYTLAADMIANRLDMDFVAANQLEIVDGKITGRVMMPLGWEKIGCFCKISVCKRFHLEEQARLFGIPMDKTLAIGDTKSDVCMVQRAGIGISFMPKDDIIAKASKNVIQEADMLQVSQFAG